MEERKRYFESLSEGLPPDEAYLDSLNRKIEQEFSLLSSGEFRREIAETSDLAVLRNGYFYQSSSFSGRISEPWRRLSPSTLSSLSLTEKPVMIIPSGGLYGIEKSERFKAVLRDYVERGGFLIVFAQQHGYEFSALPTPDGRPITGYGWREDLSCHTSSVYLSAEHPALSGLIKNSSFHCC